LGFQNNWQTDSDAASAAQNYVNMILNTNANGGVVTIALDGENWIIMSKFPPQAAYFLNQLYKLLDQEEAQGLIRTVTLQQALRYDPPTQVLNYVPTGSWVEMSFAQWTTLNQYVQNNEWSNLYMGHFFYKAAQNETRNFTLVPDGVSLLRKVEIALFHASDSDYYWAGFNEPFAVYAWVTYEEGLLRKYTGGGVTWGPNYDGTPSGQTKAWANPNGYVTITMTGPQPSDDVVVDYTDNGWSSKYAATMTYNGANFSASIGPIPSGAMVQWYYYDTTSGDYWHAQYGPPNESSPGGGYNWFLYNSYVAPLQPVKPSLVTFSESGLPSGTSWSLSVNGKSYSETSSSLYVNLTPGSYSWSVSPTVQVSPGVRMVAQVPNGTLSVPSQASVSISYTAQYLLSISFNSSEGTVVSPVHLSGKGSAWEPAGRSFYLEAVPNVGFVFLGWNVNSSALQVANSSSYLTLASMTGPASVVAQFEASNSSLKKPVVYPVLVTFSESGLPSGTSWSLSVNGKSYSETSSSLYVNLTPGSYSWSVSPTVQVSPGVRMVAQVPNGTLSVPSQASVSISYTAQYLVKVMSSNDTQGSVSGGGWVQAGVSFDVEAQPSSGYKFEGWSANSSALVISNSSLEKTTVVATGPGTLVAEFASSSPPPPPPPPPSSKSPVAAADLALAGVTGVVAIALALFVLARRGRKPGNKGPRGQ
ncbi:MAG: hypothetical protein RAK24_04980, partial [TACK group archaeon]|nr:hypothetical protein [TACK group archaeon]